MPVLQQLPGGIYQVTWEPSRDNGAPIVLYWLEGKRAGSRYEPKDDLLKNPHPVDLHMVDLNLLDNNNNNMTSNTTVSCLLFNNCSNDAVETLRRKRRATNTSEVVIPDEWTLYYNGTGILPTYISLNLLD